MTHDPGQREIPVIDSQGQRGIVIASANQSQSSADESESELVYGMGGLVVQKISEFEFRDFRGTIWIKQDARSTSSPAARYPIP